MGMTAGEKILAKASGRHSVKPGEIVYPQPELVICHDGYIASSKAQLDELGIDELFDPDKVLLITDHTVVYSTPMQAQRGVEIRKAAAAWGVKNFIDVGRSGQGHVLPMEKGYVLPGTFAFANDMHSSNNGAIGALVMRTGTEIVAVLATGTMWVEVPQTIRVNLAGRLPYGVFPRDVGYLLARKFTGGTFNAPWDYRIIEIGGEAVALLSLDERVPLCNTLTEIGVANVFFEPSEQIIEFASSVADRPFEPVYSDPDAEYEAIFELDVSTLVPQLVLPGSPDQSVDITNFLGKQVDHAVVGSCGSCMYSDMVVVGNLLRGRRVSEGTRLFLAPGTQDIARRMRAEGLSSAIEDAGAILLPAGCGPCAGGQMAQVTSGEVSISTAATNVAGRFGSSEAELFLASPATVAASAISGVITDPRDLLRATDMEKGR